MMLVMVTPTTVMTMMKMQRMKVNMTITVMSTLSLVSITTTITILMTVTEPLAVSPDSEGPNALNTQVHPSGLSGQLEQSRQQVRVPVAAYVLGSSNVSAQAPNRKPNPSAPSPASSDPACEAFDSASEYSKKPPDLKPKPDPKPEGRWLWARVWKPSSQERAYNDDMSCLKDVIPVWQYSSSCVPGPCIQPTRSSLWS